MDGRNNPKMLRISKNNGKNKGALVMPPYMKYNNVKTVIDGKKFDSKKEAKRYQELQLLKCAGTDGLHRRITND